MSSTEKVADRIKDAVATATTIYPQLGRLDILELSMAELLPPLCSIFFASDTFTDIYTCIHTHTFLASLCSSKNKQGLQEHISGIATPSQIHKKYGDTNDRRVRDQWSS